VTTDRPRTGRRNRATIGDVADAAGVSRATVSLALNDVPGARIAAATRQRIGEIADHLGYTPSRVARSLRLQRSHTIALVSDRIATTPYAGKIILGATHAARDNGWWLLLLSTEGDPDIEVQGVKQLLQHDVDGALYATMYHRLVTVPEVLSAVPTVLVDAESDDPQIPAVVPDEVGGGRAAVDLLLAAGHRTIGFATNVDDIPATRGRLAGYRQALAAAGVRFDRRRVVAAESTTAGGFVAALRLLDGAERPSALFCFNDRMAMGAYRAAAHLGLDIPGDVSIVGYDDQDPIADGLFPALTTVALPHYDMGHWAVERLIDGIERGTRVAKGDTPFRMPCPVVVRSSVRPPR
jgi:LacI family transcriptional regulator